MPKDAEPHYQLGLAYLASGNAQAGARELMQAIKLDPSHVAAQLKLAEMMVGNAEYRRGEKGSGKDCRKCSPLLRTTPTPCERWP